MSTIGASGHDWSQEVCASVVWSVHFVDVDMIDRCTGDGCVEAGEELLEGLVFSPAKYGHGLASLCGDRHGAGWFDVADDDLTMFGERVEVGIHRDGEGRCVVVGGI